MAKWDEDLQSDKGFLLTISQSGTLMPIYNKLESVP
jgi:hypothetical protein